MKRLFTVIALICLALVVDLGLDATLSVELSASAAARPGGGHSYRSSSRSSSSFGSSSRSSSGFGSSGYGSSGSDFGGSSYDYSSSGGGLDSPQDFGFVAMMLVVFFGFPFVAVGFLTMSASASWDSVPPSADSLYAEYSFTPTKPRPPRPPSFKKLRRADPNFSKIILEDFLYELYTRALTARVDPDELGALSPYLSDIVRVQLQARGGGRMVRAVEGVIIGAMRIAKIEYGKTHDRLHVDYESNYTETVPGPHGDGRIGYYAHETWVLTRKRGAKSRAAENARALNCPSCGAPVERDQHEACAYCGARHGTAEFDWMVERVNVNAEETRGPTLTGYAEEVGTHDPTVRARSVRARVEKLRADDPAFSEDALKARVRMIYDEFNASWTSLDWDDARPYLSDRLWLSMRYWIQAYQQQGLQNLMLAARVSRQEIAKVERDAFYDAVTMRVWASAIDQIVHVDSGAIVGGSEKPREYSEYWTLIRSAKRRGAASSEKNCPSCAAPLSVNMAGSCSHCGVKVTGGEFDWVLSRIEQDESYLG